MKKRLSICMFYIRCQVYRLALLLAGLLALDAAVCLLWFRGGAAFGQGAGGTALLVVTLAGYLGCVALCAAPFSRRSRYGYTLQRLQIPEHSVFLWHCAVNAVCFLIFLGAQAAAVAGLAGLWQHSADYSSGPQGVLLAFYRSELLHALLPLHELSLWVRNVIYALCAGIFCAYAQLRLRYGKGPTPILIPLSSLASSFPAPIASLDATIVMYVFLALCVGICLFSGLSTAHHGTRRVEEDETV